jgi:hypothetical protein
VHKPQVLRRRSRSLFPDDNFMALRERLRLASSPRLVTRAAGRSTRSIAIPRERLHLALRVLQSHSYRPRSRPGSGRPLEVPTRYSHKPGLRSLSAWKLREDAEALETGPRKSAHQVRPAMLGSRVRQPVIHGLEGSPAKVTYVDRERYRNRRGISRLGGRYSLRSSFLPCPALTAGDPYHIGQRLTEYNEGRKISWERIWASRHSHLPS